MAWAVTQAMGYRDAIYYSVTGERFSGAEAAAMKFVNKSVPLAQLREQTMELARKLEAKSPAAVRYTKEAVRSVRGMSHEQALDYLNCKSDALKHIDPENGRALYLAAGMQVRLGDAEGARRNIEAALRLQPDDFGTLYNAACTYTHMDDPGRALDLLERAISAGHGFRDWIENDSDLDSLRGLPRYREILARLE